MNIAFITPLAPVKETDKCKDPAYKKKNPTKCKNASTTAKVTIPTLSSGLKTTAQSGLQATKPCTMVYGQWVCP